MSTMLKTAAMSLLSKTLQTFLYKYLSDVDVEGVALPSVYDGSGWGVRLSNVKLREGVQLMEQMPGKQVKRRKRKKKKRLIKRHVSDDVLAGVNADASQKNRTSMPPTDYKDDFPDGPQTPTRRKRDFTQGNDEYEEKLKHGDGWQEASLHFSDMDQLLPTRSRASSTDQLEISVDEGDSATISSPPTRPSTPLQDSKSIFSCFTKGKKGDKQKGDDATASLPDMHNLDEPPADDDASSKPPVSAVEDKLKREFSALELDEKEEVEDVEESSRMAEPTIEDEETNDEDEFEEYEQPFRLCLGDNGRIGTLDIRLVDRELHVMVEDALLTIEAFPVTEETTEEEEEGTDENIADGQGKSTTDGGASTTSAGVAPSKPPVPPKPSTKTPKAEPKRATVGDRVLADNPLARAIAAVPHLLLRDIRIRLIIRKEPKAPKADEDNGTDGAEKAGTTSPSSNQPGPGDTMLEIGIEFLSVNSGEDILSSFDQTDDSKKPEGRNGDDSSKRTPPLASVRTSSSVGTSLDHNEYMTRHIRTGRGPAAGIWVQVFAPGPKLPARIGPPDGDIVWARQRWVMATNFYLLRCSGIDIRARIHLGSKKQGSSYSWFYDYDDESGEYTYDDDTLDSMLVGFDSIAPGPQLPLPPINPDMSRGDSPVKKEIQGERAASYIDTPPLEPVPAMHPGSVKYTKDSNNVQSCNIPSTFHRISRGLAPGSCKDCAHLPSETCAMCWEGPVTVSEESTLDASMPMPGLALQVIFREQLEINVDRPSVETLNLLKTLFVKKRETTNSDAVELDEKKAEEQVRHSVSRSSTALDDATKTTSSTKSSFFGFLSSRTKEPEKEEVKSDAFSQNMQPENIQVLGMHFSEIIFRVHVMQDERLDGGVSFCYWDILATCLTVDLQSCNSKETLSTDLRFDVGLLAWDEFCGVGSKRLVALGVPLHLRAGTDSSNSVSTTKSLVDDHSQNKTPWPSAACALMDIPPPPETLPYKGREGHGLQMRFISVRSPEESSKVARSMVNVRLGTTTTQLPWGFWREIDSVRKQLTWGVLGKPQPSPLEDGSASIKSSGTKDETTPPVTSIMTYNVQIDGGSIAMDPVINLSMPLTRFAGERSPGAGISFESILNKFHIAYGQNTERKSTSLSLQQLASLPENVRTRILFCLDDLKTLEQALEVKQESNPFKRTRAVNKGIVKMARRLSKTSQLAINRRTNSRRANSDAPERRQKIMTALMKLDNDELNELWASHQRQRRKRVKHRTNPNSSSLPSAT